MYTDRRTETQYAQLRKLPTILCPINDSNCLRPIKLIVSISCIKMRAQCFSDELLTISDLAINHQHIQFLWCAFSLPCSMLRLCTISIRFVKLCRNKAIQGRHLSSRLYHCECENDHRKSRWRRKTEAKINVYLGIYSEPSSSFVAVPTTADKDETRTYNCYSSFESPT